MLFLNDRRNTRNMTTRRRTPTPPTLNVRNQPAIDMLIRGYDLSKKIAEFTRDYHRMYAFNRALTALRCQTEHIIDYEQAVLIDDIKEFFGLFIVEAVNGMIPTALNEQQDCLNQLIDAQLDEDGI